MPKVTKQNDDTILLSTDEGEPFDYSFVKEGKEVKVVKIAKAPAKKVTSLFDVPLFDLFATKDED